MDSNMYILDS